MVCTVTMNPAPALEAFFRKLDRLKAGDAPVLAGWLESGDYAAAHRMGAAAGPATAFSDGLAAGSGNHPSRCDGNRVRVKSAISSRFLSQEVICLLPDLKHTRRKDVYL